MLAHKQAALCRLCSTTSLAAWLAYIATLLLALSMASSTGSAEPLPPFLTTFSYNSVPLVTVKPTKLLGPCWWLITSNGPNPRYNPPHRPWFIEDWCNGKSRQVHYIIAGSCYYSTVFADGSPSELHLPFQMVSK